MLGRCQSVPWWLVKQSRFSEEIQRSELVTSDLLVNSSCSDLITQRLEREAHVWQYLDHPNVSEFLGLAFNFGYMPALILPVYGNGTVMEYVKEKDIETRLDMVPVFPLLDFQPSDAVLCR